MPDYRGMFLRGYGSQSYSQDNGERVGTTSTTYSSGTVGQIQGDATREFKALVGFHTGGDSTEHTIKSNYADAYAYTDIVDDSSPLYYHGYITNNDPVPFEISGPGGAHQTYYKYKYSMSCSEDSCSLNEEEPIFIAQVGYTHSVVAYAMSSGNPVANEIRPVNVAVKFMIKAK